MFDNDTSPSFNTAMATMILYGVCLVLFGIPSMFNPVIAVILLHAVAGVSILSCIAMIFSAITDIDLTTVLTDPIFYNRTILKWFNTHDHFRLGWWKIHRITHSGCDIDTIITLSRKGVNVKFRDNPMMKFEKDGISYWAICYALQKCLHIREKDIVLASAVKLEDSLYETMLSNGDIYMVNTEDDTVNLVTNRLEEMTSDL